MTDATRTVAVAAAVTALAAVGGALHYAGSSPTTVFVLTGAALGGLAWIIGLATEVVGARFGPAITGVLQSTLGNLPELFIVLFSLSAGEIVVAQTSILGSLFANALLVLGLAIVAGARAAPDRMMAFRKRLPNDTATLLLLALFAIALLGLSDRLGDRASRHQVAISVVGAVCLLAVYAAWLWSYLRSDPRVEPALEEHEQDHGMMPFTIAVGALAVAGVAAAFVSDWFVAAIDPAVQSLGISKAFTGIVIVGIAGNAVENVVGITLAAGGKANLAVSVVKNSVAQIACFLFPALVLLSLLFADRLTFVLNPVYIGALGVTALALWQITGDGEAYAYEGLALVAIYVILATLTFYEYKRRCASQATLCYERCRPTSRRSAVTSSRRSSRHAPGASPSRSSPA
jgi:Ca2+:H+ antiporter